MCHKTLMLEELELRLSEKIKKTKLKQILTQKLRVNVIESLQELVSKQTKILSHLVVKHIRWIKENLVSLYERQMLI